MGMKKNLVSMSILAGAMLASSDGLYLDDDLTPSKAVKKLKKYKSLKGAPVSSKDYKKTKAGLVKIDKTRRNDPCTCGSGKKYKKCCL